MLTCELALDDFGSVVTSSDYSSAGSSRDRRTVPVRTSRTGTPPVLPARTGDTDSPAPRPRTQLRQDLLPAQCRAGTDTYGRITLAEITCRPTPAYQVRTGNPHGA